MADRRLFQDIVERITALIEEGVFPPGSRLPGERELAERFGVSRVTIREAEIALQAIGKVKIKTGSGVYVSDGSVSGLDELPQVSAFELTEARSLFESEAAALAAPIISQEGLQRLDELLVEMAKDDATGDQGPNNADREFHMMIASASGNAAISYVIQTLWRLRDEVPGVRAAYDSVCHHDGNSRHREHADVVEALKKRDPSGARLAMRRHFNRLLEAMLDASEERQIEELRQRSAESRARFLISAKLS
ncbi:FadR/GntR family transcriptional regulator [Sphingomonas sp. LY54]|uniref:FadR/GntR family transcriptional regulator n=1 Tax=Sphingomonas sp. LY54 TaxID=3095343 RepID=UPI002D7A006E|nr:FadR/GntR family transcriptional regulator [Sphingomonas sp. LY54]WRP28383.1 FadR/GntR family transcriptional regulator [Sphingomonas sp. LY54]